MALVLIPKTNLTSKSQIMLIMLVCVLRKLGVTVELRAVADLRAINCPDGQIIERESADRAARNLLLLLAFVTPCFLFLRYIIIRLILAIQIMQWAHAANPNGSFFQTLLIPIIANFISNKPKNPIQSRFPRFIFW